MVNSDTCNLPFPALITFATWLNDWSSDGMRLLAKPFWGIGIHLHLDLWLYHRWQQKGHLLLLHHPQSPRAGLLPLLNQLRYILKSTFTLSLFVFLPPLSLLQLWLVVLQNGCLLLPSCPAFRFWYKAKSHSHVQYLLDHICSFQCSSSAWTSRFHNSFNMLYTASTLGLCMCEVRFDADWLSHFLIQLCGDVSVLLTLASYTSLYDNAA